MNAAIVFGHWGIRHAEPGDGIRLKDVALALPPFCRSIILDLRHMGEQNLGGSDSPLAIVQKTSSGLQLVALVMRQEKHLIHFVAPAPLPACRAEELADVLRSLFERWHLPLNNFECNSHLAAQDKIMQMSFRLDGSIALFRDVLADKAGSGAWPGFHLRLGNEHFWSNGEVTVLGAPSGKLLLSVQRGCRRKKAHFDAIDWHVERFVETCSGEWMRSSVLEPQAIDLRPFDQRPENVASFVGGAPLVNIGRLNESLLRVSVESTASCAFFEVDAVRYHRPLAAKSDRSGHYVTVRAAEGRWPLEKEAVHADMLYLCRHLQEISEGRLFDERPSEAFARHVLTELALPCHDKACKLTYAGGVGDAVMPRASPAVASVKRAGSQLRLAVVGPSGSGKSTVVAALAAFFASQGRSVSMQKLAEPLYRIQAQFYAAAGRQLKPNIQDQVLLETIAKCLRGISASALVDNLESKLRDAHEDVVLNDDLRDNETDLPRLRALGFRIIRVVTAETARLERLAARNDLSIVGSSNLDQQVALIEADCVLNNTASGFEGVQPELCSLARFLIAQHSLESNECCKPTNR
jgi:dephospho-CoA kinase